MAIGGRPLSGGPPKGIDEKLTEHEREAFYDHSSDRSIAIILSAIVENHLTSLLRLIMRRDTTVAEELFRSTGPLGPFGTKIRLAYMLRILHETTYKDLIIISRIRNRFAHDLTVTAFDDQQITAWIKNMYMYSIVKKMGDEANERLTAEAGVDVTQRVHDQIAADALLSSKDSYRQCARFIIHHIADMEYSIRAAEAELNSGEQSA